MDVHALYDGSLIATVERGGPPVVEAALYYRLPTLPRQGLVALRESGLVVGEIPYTTEDMPIRKMLVIRSKEL